MHAYQVSDIPELERKIHSPSVKLPKPNPKSYTVVSVRLREAEYISFMEQIRPYGITGNLAMRIAARRIAGFLEIDADVRQSLQRITNSIGDMADSLKTIADSNPRDVETVSDIRKAFGAEFVRLDSQMQEILNVSKRRHDGQTMLVEASK